MSKLFTCLLVCLFGAAAAPALAQTYTVTDLGKPGSAAGTLAAAANEAGTAVGSIFPRQGPASLPAKFVNGRVVDLTGRAGIEATWGRASGINEHGTLVGLVGTDLHPKGQLMISRGVDLQLVTPPGQGRLEVNGINRHGQVVGTGRTAAGDCRCAFIYHPDRGEFEFLYGQDSRPDGAGLAIDSHGRVYGMARVHGVNRAVMWHQGKLRPLPDLGGTYSYAQAANGLGDVVGASFTPTAATHTHAMLVRGGVAIDLDGDDTRPSMALAINDTRVVVGSMFEDRGWVGFVSQDGGRLHNLNRLISEADQARWRIDEAVAVDNQGRITGSAYDVVHKDWRAVRLTPVPAAH